MAGKHNSARGPVGPCGALCCHVGSVAGWKALCDPVSILCPRGKLWQAVLSYAVKNAVKAVADRQK